MKWNKNGNLKFEGRNFFIDRLLCIEEALNRFLTKLQFVPFIAFSQKCYILKYILNCVKVS